MLKNGVNMNSSQIEETLNTSDEGVKTILSTILNMNMWDRSKEKIIITEINKLLSVSKSRLQGLELLNLIINNCSATVLSENGIMWISHCLTKYPDDNLKDLKLTTIGIIVENSFEEQDFTKKFISEYISKVLEICLAAHCNSHEVQVSLETLGICMKHYGSWFAPHKQKLENFIISYLENPSEQVVENSSIAFHYLQQVGGAGTDGINHKTNFSKNFEKLCTTVHTLFDNFFENEIEIDQSDRSNQDVFEFTDLSHYTQKMLHITARRIKNSLQFLKTMLLKGFPVEKEIKPIDVLNLISRGTAIHRCISTVKDHSLEDFQYSILLNQVHIELLRLLHTLIIWLHTNALPFTFTITKILIDCLNKSQSCQCFKTDSIYQEMVYKVLSCWIRIAKGAVHTHFQTQLIKCILKDIVPITSSVTLNLQTDTYIKSEKAKQKAIQEKIISSGKRNSTADEMTIVEKFNREKNCSFALETLRHLLFGTILKLKPNILQELYTSIIGILVDLQVSKINHPYTNLECQAKLYEVLVAFYEQDTLKTLPPLPLTIEILNKGINSTNRTIALICEQGLTAIEKICQPICSSLFVPDEITTIKQFYKESVSFTDSDDKNMKNAQEEIEKDSSSADLNNCGELDIGALNIAENETDTQENANGAPGNEANTNGKGTDIRENGTHTNEEAIEMHENVGTAVNEETIDDSELTTNLKHETSIHIIDMQIIKTSSNDIEPQGIVNSEDHAANDDLPSLTVEEQRQEESEESSLHIKNELLSQSNMDIQEPVTASSTENDEPPLKRIKSEEIVQKVKKEELRLEDDIFEEGDDFVDMVKEY